LAGEKIRKSLDLTRSTPSRPHPKVEGRWEDRKIGWRALTVRSKRYESVHLLMLTFAEAPVRFEILLNDVDGVANRV